MCVTCGCSDGAQPRVTGVTAVPHSHAGHEHDHEFGHEHPAASLPPVGPEEPQSRTITFEQQVLAKNDRLAGHNRDWLAAHDILAVNLMSSPGSGKTTLLERTIRDLSGEWPISVIEGDQETVLDAERIRSTGSPVVQINTGAGCHLDAEMLSRGLSILDPQPSSLLFVENVGNLVCPAMFDLGERGKIVIMSVTEGDDKPLKYPQMFRAAQLMVINKVDLLPYVQFDVDRCIGFARQINPDLETLQVSATRGDGLDTWYGWLRARMPAAETVPQQ
ncbi:MAG: hydrogenase accessory protein HypB [Pseudonocardiales bacterium]|nr:MAG: hydrogenase accessory protein HypB [Pseudonocardiales bacterium]